VAEITKKYPDLSDNGVQRLFRMLAPTNPGMTVETIKLLPWDVACRLLIVLIPKAGFLPSNQSKPAETVDLKKGDAHEL
jgi:hypothetical protein